MGGGLADGGHSFYCLQFTYIVAILPQRPKERK